MGDEPCHLTVTCLSSGLTPTSALLRRLFDYTTKIQKDDTLDSVSDGSCYEETTFAYRLEVTPARDRTSTLERVIGCWRDPGEMQLVCGSVPGWWLSWTEVDESRLSEHYDLKLRSFSLGSFVGLSSFIEHYSSCPKELSSAEPAKAKKPGPVKQPPSKSMSSGSKRQYRITQSMVHFAHYHRHLYVYFVDVKEPLVEQERSGETHARHRFVIDYSSVQRVVVSKNSDNGDDSGLVAYLHLSHPPLLYRVHETHRSEKDNDDDDECDTRKPKYVEQHEVNVCTKWVRTVTFGKHDTKCSSGVLGLCRVIALAFSRSTQKAFLEALSRLRTLSSSTSLFNGAVESKPRKQGVGDASKELNVKDLPFGCAFALAAVWSSSAQVADELLLSGNKAKAGEALRRMASEDPEALEEALYSLQQAFDKGRLTSFQAGLEVLYNRYHVMRQQPNALTGGVLGQQLPTHVVLVRRVVLTPTRILPMPPQPISTSRILVHFEPEYALRVLLRDEDGSKMSFSLGIQRRDFLSFQIRPKLLDGITIAGRKYMFLAASTSQLRSHGAWFYSLDSKGRSAEDVRSALGDLSSLRLPSKYMARLGLAFSQSLGKIHVRQECTSVEPDITLDGPRKKLHYIFSDGVGRISSSLLAKVHEVLPREGRPSGVQIRYGGCKGMLVEDPTLEGDCIIFRESMFKHPSDSEDLFILKTSRPRIVKLNRPMITILSQKMTHGKARCIEDSVFIQLQQETLAPYMDSLFEDAAAARLLHEECALRLPYKELANAGLELHAEPFFRSLLWTLHQRCLQQLREKASIAIPPEYGRTMFGVMDETGTLQYGQVFVQYARDLSHFSPDDSYEILKGNVIVTKNPCVHLGDIRRLEAVDVPALRHIRDCIVFPSIGKRPHPNEMAGSDLDGDEYSVIWHPLLVFKRNDEAMDFYDDDAVENEGPIGVSDMVDFVCKYIEHDVVGLISNAHLAWADWLREGIRSNMCIRLAHKVARAVDFAKRGQPERLAVSEKPAAYPDFMQKHSEKLTYLSRRVLGQLYRQLDGMVLDSVGPVGDVQPDSRLIIEGHEEHMDAARKALKRYRLRVRSLLSTYGIESEVEALSGAVMTMDSRISEKHDHSDVAVVVESQVKHIMACSRADFLEGLGGDFQDARKRASAWYHCAYEQGAQAEGFAWCVAEELRAVLDQAAPLNGTSVRGSMRDRMTVALLPRGDQSGISFEKALFNNAYRLLRLWLEGNEGCLWGSNNSDKADTSNEMVIYLKRTKAVLLETLVQLYKRFGQARVQRQPALLLVHCLRNFVLKRQRHGGSKHDSILADLAERTLHRLLYASSEAKNGDLPVKAVTPVGPTRKEVLLLPLWDDNDFFLKVVRQERRFRGLLQRWMQLEDIEFAIWKDPKGDWYLQLMATGSPWAFGRLKRTIIHERFHEEMKKILEDESDIDREWKQPAPAADKDEA